MVPKRKRNTSWLVIAAAVAIGTVLKFDREGAALVCSTLFPLYPERVAEGSR